MRAPYRVRADLYRLGDEQAVPPHLDPGPATVFRGDSSWSDLVGERLAALERHPHEVRSVDPRVAPERLQAAGLAVARHAAATLPQRLRLDGEALTLPALGLRVAPDGTLTLLAGAAESSGGHAATADSAHPDAAHAHGSELATGSSAARARQAHDLLAARPTWLRQLEAVALAVQEDLVLIGPALPAEEVGRDAAAGRVAWLQVAFPSGWDPGAMAGASFERLHAPVPHAGPLRRAAPALVSAMLTKGPFVRYVWGIAPDGGRSRHPRRARPLPPDLPLERAWLRVERQTTLPLPEVGFALFAIGVHVTRVPQALATPARCAAFAAAIASLDPATKRYKGVPWSSETVAAWCRARAR